MDDAENLLEELNTCLRMPDAILAYIAQDCQRLRAELSSSEEQRDEPPDDDSSRRQDLAYCLVQQALLPAYSRHKNSEFGYTESNDLLIEELQNASSSSSSISYVACPAHLVDLTTSWAQVLYIQKNTDLQKIFNDSPFIRILLKALARKNARRNFHVVIWREMEAFPAVREAVIQWILCSLLGNYEHCPPKERADLRTQRFLYAYFGHGVSFPPIDDPTAWNDSALLNRIKQSGGPWPESNLMAAIDDMIREGAFEKRNAAWCTRSHAWFACTRLARRVLRCAIILSCRTVFEHAIHEYTISLTMDCPALREHADEMLEFSAYAAITAQAMTAARDYVRKNMCYGGSMSPAAVLQAEFGLHGLPKACKIALESIDSKQSWKPLQRDNKTPYATELDELLKPFIDKLVKVSERKFRTPFCSMVRELSVSTKEQEDTENDKDKDKNTLAVPIPIPDKSQAQQEDRAEHVWDLFASKRRPVPSPVPQQQQQQQQRPKPIDNLGLPKHICALLYDICECVADCISMDQAFMLVLDRLIYLGAPEQAVRLFRAWTVEYRSLPGTHSIRQSKYRSLRLAFPVTCQMVCASASILEHVRQIRRIDLPSDLAQRQCRAIQERTQRLYGNANTRNPDSNAAPALLVSEATLSVCTVCNSTKNRTVDTDSTFRSSDFLGMKDVNVDYWQDPPAVYCVAEKRFAHRSCEDDPVSRQLAVGQRYEIDKSMQHFCGHCGKWAVMNPSLSIWTEAGPTCWICTKEEFRRRYNQATSHHPVAAMSLGRGCLVCGRQIKKTQDMFIFGYQTVLCPKHPRSAIRDHLEEKLDDATWDNFMDPSHANTIRSLVLVWCKRYKDNLTSKQVKRQAGALYKANASQQNNRMRHWNVS